MCLLQCLYQLLIGIMSRARYICCRYLVLKDSFIAYLQPDKGTVSDVLLMDRDFRVKCGIGETGFRNGLIVSNLSR